MAPLAVQICCSAVRWTPVVFITAIVLWSYYAYVVQMCIYAVENPAEKVIYLLLYHPLIVMFMWSYAKTIFTQVGTVPKQNAVSILRPLYVSTEHEHLYQDGVDSIVVGWSVFLRLKVMQQLHKQCSMKSIKCLFRGNDPQFYLPKQEADRLERETNEEVQKTILVNFARNSNLPVQNRTHSGAPRYCEKCHCIKPDRCHHCSVCGVCVLKMDHHCPWVNNCVGFTTYKFFVMFLGYALLYCIYVALTSLKYFIQFWSSGLSNNMGRFHVLFLFFVAVMFAISLISLFGYHCYLTAHNRSTLESFRSPIFQSGPDKNGFSLGKRNNFIEIFGENRKLWFIPVFTSEGDGVTFPTRTPSASSSYQTMGNTTPTVSSAGDGVTFPTRTVDLDSDGLLADRQRWMEEGELEQMGNGRWSDTGALAPLVLLCNASSSCRNPSNGDMNVDSDVE